MLTAEKNEHEDPSSRLPSSDEIRAALHAGFADAIAYMPADRRERFMSSCLEQGQRRERNISEFIESVGAGSD